MYRWLPFVILILLALPGTAAGSAPRIQPRPEASHGAAAPGVVPNASWYWLDQAIPLDAPWSAPPSEDPKGDYGEDDETLVEDTTVYPYSATCRLSFQTGGGHWGSCSGTLIHPFHVITAGHCVHYEDNGGWNMETFVSPGFDQGDTPFGTARAVEIAVLPEWLENESHNHDIALITLDRLVGDFAGTLGTETLEDPDDYAGLMLHSNHYPGSPIGNARTMFHSYDEVLGSDDQAMGHYLDTAPGSSGASLYREMGGEHRVLAVNSSDWTGLTNLAPILTADRVAWLDAIIAAAPEPLEGPDLVAGSCQVLPTIVTLGEEMLVSLRHSNSGTLDTGGFEVVVVLSDDEEIDLARDWILGTVAVDSLAPFTNQFVELALPLPDETPTGDFHVAVVLDPGQEVAQIYEGDEIAVCDAKALVEPAPLDDDDDAAPQRWDDDGAGCACPGSDTWLSNGAAVVLLTVTLAVRRRI